MWVSALGWNETVEQNKRIKQNSNIWEKRMGIHWLPLVLVNGRMIFHKM